MVESENNSTLLVTESFKRRKKEKDIGYLCIYNLSNNEINYRERQRKRIVKNEIFLIKLRKDRKK